MNGVSPDEAKLDSIAGPGSEKRTFFFVRFGVSGGVAMPWGCNAAGRELLRDREVGPALLRRGRRTARGLSSSIVIVESLSRLRSAIVEVGGVNCLLTSGTRRSIYQHSLAEELNVVEKEEV